MCLGVDKDGNDLKKIYLSSEICLEKILSYPCKEYFKWKLFMAKELILIDNVGALVELDKYCLFRTQPYLSDCKEVCLACNLIRLH
jgi:hypothetical protein